MCLLIWLSRCHQKIFIKALRAVAVLWKSTVSINNFVTLWFLASKFWNLCFHFNCILFNTIFYTFLQFVCHSNRVPKELTEFWTFTVAEYRSLDHIPSPNKVFGIEIEGRLCRARVLAKEVINFGAYMIHDQALHFRIHTVLCILQTEHYYAVLLMDKMDILVLDARKSYRMCYLTPMVESFASVATICKITLVRIILVCTQWANYILFAILFYVFFFFAHCSFSTIRANRWKGSIWIIIIISVLYENHLKSMRSILS